MVYTVDMVYTIGMVYTVDVDAVLSKMGFGAKCWLSVYRLDG